MSSEEVGANTWEAASKGEQAEVLADAMAGLEATFDALMDDLKDKADWLEYGYTQFKINLQPDICTVQTEGMQLAETIQEGAAGIAETDHEAGDDFKGAWGQMPDVNF